ncbi:MAG: glycosyltransferase, partial [Proteobacteria bacterium]|nr:glycosyltransferase [Pseudomonadota bacterium]
MDSVLVLALASGLALAAWLYLFFLHGGYWRADQCLAGDAPEPGNWPSVVAIVPARDEAASIGNTVASVLAQDYPGPLRLIVVDDGSTDGTAEAAHGVGLASRRANSLRVIPGHPLEPGWSGKLWAVEQGWRQSQDGDFIWLTDADIRHGPSVLRNLVGKAVAERRVLVSLMVKLRCQSILERLLIPAFVYFFQKLYPFARVNDPDRAEAAAAGGCILVDRSVLTAAGGIAAIKGALIDDCAMARLLKSRGPIWLGLTTESDSLRAYDALSEIWSMVARTAYVQLDRSPWMLIGTVLGMLLLYALPPGAFFLGIWAGAPAAVALG